MSLLHSALLLTQIPLNSAVPEPQPAPLSADPITAKASYPAPHSQPADLTLTASRSIAPPETIKPQAEFSAEVSPRLPASPQAPVLINERPMAAPAVAAAVPTFSTPPPAPPIAPPPVPAVVVGAGAAPPLDSPAIPAIANQAIALPESATLAEAASPEPSESPLEEIVDDPMAATSSSAIAPAAPAAPNLNQVAQGQQVVVSFFINEEPQEQLVLRRSPTDPAIFFLESAPLLELLEDQLRFDVLETLELATDASGFLSSELLRQNGLELVFDDRKLELYLRIPVELRRGDFSDGSLPPEVEAALKPSRVSGYLNLRGSQELSWPDESNPDLRRQPLRVGFEGVLNLDGWVLEGSGNFTEGRNPNLSRNNVRLVHDVPAHALRYVVGDLNFPITGYQSNLPMGGIAIARNFSLQPYRVVQPLNQWQFLLERPARVEIYLNGTLIRTLQLPAGVQDIRNLSLNEGINNLQLIITDDLGEVKRIDFSTGLARNLLGAGLEQFAYGIGFPSSRTTNGYTYDWQNPILNLAHRWGINNNVTMGAYFQGDLQHQLLGWEGLWANELGNFEWDIAASRDRANEVDYAFRLRYDYIRNGRTNPSQRRLGLLLNYQGERFAPLDPFAANSLNSFTFGVDYREELIGGIFTNLNASYSLGRQDTPDSYSLLVGFNKFFANGISANLNLSHSQDQWGDQEQRVLLNLSWLFPQRRQTIAASTEMTSSRRPSYQVNWTIGSPASFRGIDTTLRATENSFARNLNARLRYRGYRGNLDLAHDLRLPIPRQSTLSRFSQFLSSSGPVNTTRFNFETAIVFADGVFGWSRPVNNSFAIVVPDANLAGQRIGVNPLVNSYTAQIDGMGPAVLPELQPYRLSTLRVTPADSSPTYSLSQELFRVFPSYRSGTLVRLQSVLPVTLDAQLLYPDQSPIAIRNGAVVSTSGALARPLMFTTDATGRITVSGLKPGDYEIRLFTAAEELVIITIPPGHSGIFEAGSLITTPTYEDDEDDFEDDSFEDE